MSEINKSQKNSIIGRWKSFRRKTKNYLINPSYQLRYLFFFALASTIPVTLFGVFIYGCISENYAILVELSPITSEARQQLYRELHQIILDISGISLVFIIVISILTIILTHRTAGALYHFKRVFQEIEKGNLKARIQLRQNDDFRDVAQAFNDMMDRLNIKR